MNVAEWLVLGVLTGFSAYDLKTRKVPVMAVVLCGTAALVYRFCAGTGIAELILGLVPGLCMLALAFFTKESIGTGDGLVLCALGMFCGLRRTLAILGMALVLAAALAIVLLVLRRVERKTELPFLPNLMAGYLLCLLW